MNITRRQGLAVLGGGLAMGLATAARAQSAKPPVAADTQASSNAKPYELVKPVVTSDHNRVRLLFSYDCPHCRSYHNGLVQWGATLPKPFTFVATPVITSADDARQAMAVYGRLLMQMIAPAKLPSYDYAAYVLLQGDADSGTPAKSDLRIEDVLRAVVAASGMAAKDVQQAIKTKAAGLEKRIPEHGQLIKTYGLTATPSVAISGRILVNPDHANSNPQQFLLLLNGMVSRIMSGGANGL